MFISNSNYNIHTLLVRMYRLNEIIVNLGCLLMFFNINDRRDSIVAHMWLIHFIKRVYEVTYIHNYTRTTDSVSFGDRLFEVFYFNIFSYFITGELNNNFDFNWANKLLVFIWGWAQMQNYICHLHLARLPNNIDTNKSIPHGQWFNIYTAPNYSFELLSWLCFTLVSGSRYSTYFTICSGIRMYKRSKVKKNYYKTLNSHYDNNLLFPNKK